MPLALYSVRSCPISIAKRLQIGMRHIFTQHFGPEVSTMPMGAPPMLTRIAPKFERIAYDVRLEEEHLQGYKADYYYPVRFGQTFHNRFKTIGKLGYGSASTVWLCRDIRRDNEYVALKVYINSSEVHRELPIYKHINATKLGHGGRAHVRKLLESFEIEGPHGKHVCLVLQPMGPSLDELRDLTSDGLFKADVLREGIRHVLVGLQFLHDAHIIHTDLQPNNILAGIDDPSVFAKFEQHEAENPAPRKEIDGRTIYMSRPMPLTKGYPALCDLSEARLGHHENTDLIMPDVYRAPEVVLNMPWSYSVDIWAVGMVIWDLFEGNRLFKNPDAGGRYSESYQLAKMIAIMGPPPLDFLRRSKKSDFYWDRDGRWRGLAPIPDLSLETLELRLQGEEKNRFLAFIRKMLRWKPESRSDCKDILFDEWLLADLITSGEVVRDELIP